MPQLAHLDARDRASLDLVRRELHELYGDALRAVALTGEAAGAGYRPGRSSLELAVVLEAVTPEALRRVRPRLGGWGRRRIATPLFLDERWLTGSRDVFPIEFLELREHHVLLHGEGDPFAGLPVQAEHLRLEVERQLRGKLLHLWEAYLDTRGSRRRLRALLLAAVPGFAWILRGALHLAEGQEPRPPCADSETLFAEAERRFGVSLPVLRRLERVRRGAETLPAAELETRLRRRPRRAARAARALRSVRAARALAALLLAALVAAPAAAAQVERSARPRRVGPRCDPAALGTRRRHGGRPLARGAAPHRGPRRRAPPEDGRGAGGARRRQHRARGRVRLRHARGRGLEARPAGGEGRERPERRRRRQRPALRRGPRRSQDAHVHGLRARGRAARRPRGRDPRPLRRARLPRGRRRPWHRGRPARRRRGRSPPRPA